jgi:hypothetical protein
MQIFTLNIQISDPLLKAYKSKTPMYVGVTDLENTGGYWK